MAELESLKAQIDTIRREIARRENAPVPGYGTEAELELGIKKAEIDEMRAVLETLERLYPPF